ncbi:serine hydrolase domain-containing protein [Rhodopseudomonas boonkerdii]|uniref:serine hydrolase domain-containing protein n=1 Tax=Rhodopseudomonas boonkerdii TaxID=475937 RepID=UPI001E541243|nr:serine hydrolase domain-containing protein [Rhodopseudomonas boonkerdii]
MAVKLICPATAASNLLSEAPDLTGFSQAGLDRVTEMLDREVGQGHLAGAIMLIQRHGKPVYYQGFGVRNPETMAPMTRDTIFRLYSMTKPITSAAAMVLVEQGKLKLDDPISKYIPAFGSAQVATEKTDASGRKYLDFAPALRPITVLDLMRQSSGISSAFTDLGLITQLYLKAGLFDGDFDNRDFADRLAKLPLAYQPATVWDYGHSTDVLGSVIEVASGMSLYDFEKQFLFDPIGMVDTSYTISDPSKAARIAQPLPTDRIIGNETISDPTIKRKWESGGGGLNGTTDDYARFLQMLLNGGEIDGKRILRPETVALMRKNEVAPATEVKPWAYYYPGAGFGYGLGFGVRTGPGEDGVPGFLGEMAWGGAAGTYFWTYPDHDMVMILMVQTPTQRGRIQPILKTLVYEAIAK